MKLKTLSIPLILALGISVNASAVVDHFDAKGKPPSKFTIEKQNQVRQSLSFNDKRDFEDAKKGLIAEPSFRQIKNDQGEVIWDIGAYDFLLKGKTFDSINPSLERMAILNMGYGLFEVVPDKIYQIRGFDLSNITFIKGDTGWIVFDPLISEEVARAALDFINEKLGKRPVTGVVYSHTHVDHYGGVRGILSEKDANSGKVPIIAPEGFMQHAISENVNTGNAMTRRSFFQYGQLLPVDPHGHVDQSLGKGTSSGRVGLFQPNTYITKDFETLTIDGVVMEFQSTPDTEAPVEMNTYFPQFKAFWSAENITATIHNIYTLRGAATRNALNWSHHINMALHRYGKEAEVMFASHHWPRWGNARIQESLKVQRDVYAHLNNSVLHAANQGVTINEIQNVYKLPESLQKHWEARSYHGSEKVNARAVINRSLGYWDGNPATLIPLSPRDSAPLYVEMMGGSSKILAKGKELFDQGKYLEASEIVNKLVYAEPKNSEAKYLLADIFEQLGYQDESTSVRNSFLAAAYELRNGIPQGRAGETVSVDTIRAMSTQLYLNFLGILVDSDKATGMNFSINLITPDNNEKFLVEMSNSVLTNLAGVQEEKPSLTITVNRSELEKVMGGRATIEDLVASGAAKLDGDKKVLNQLRSTFVQFNPRFEMMPGTTNRTQTPNTVDPMTLPIDHEDD